MIPSRAVLVNGVWHVGTDPWRECGWCGTKFDNGEFESCPICAAEIAEDERQHWAALRHEALTGTPKKPVVH
jgi:hypothetical protein